MHILRHNYFENQLCEKGADYYGGGARLTDDQKLVNGLKEIRDAYPLDPDFLIWVYVANKYGIGRFVEGAGERDVSGMSIRYLRKKYDGYKALLTALDKEGVHGTLEEWANCHLSKIGKKIISYGIYKKDFDTQSSVSSMLENSWNREALDAEYSRHQNVMNLSKEIDKINLDHILSFMGEGNVKALTVTSNFDMAALDIPVPEFDRDSIRAVANDMSPNSRDDISGFGNDVAIEASNVISQLARYFTMQAAKPNHTIALVNEIVAKARDEDAVIDLLKDDPNWFARTFSKPQLLSVDQMPMNTLVEKAMLLPVMAEKDNEAFSHDLKIVDHALEILSEYHRGIETHYDVLKQQQDRLQKMDGDRGDVMDAIVSATTPERVERQLSALQDNMLFIRENAKNFASIGDLTSNLRTQLSAMSNIATAVQAPAMNAIHQFNAYQVRRFKQFGRAVDDTVLDEFNITASEMTAIDDATPLKSQKNIMGQLQKMIGNLDAVPSVLLSTVDEREKVAEKMQNGIVDHAVRPTKGRQKTLDY